MKNKCNYIKGQAANCSRNRNVTCSVFNAHFHFTQIRPPIAARSSNLRSQRRLQSAGGREGKLLLWENESKSVSRLLWNIIVRRLWVIECYFTDLPSRQGKDGGSGALRKYFLLQDITLEKFTFLTREVLFKWGVLQIKTRRKSSNTWQPWTWPVTTFERVHRGHPEIWGYSGFRQE